MSMPDLWWSEMYGLIRQVDDGYETEDMIVMSELPGDAERLVVQRSER